MKDRHLSHMTPSRIHRLTLTHFRNYRAAGIAARGDMVAAGRPERRRKDQLPGGDLVSLARPRACAARRWKMSPTIRATAPGRCPPRSRARLGSRRSAPASTPRGDDAPRHQPALPHRPRAGRLGHGLRRSLAHGLADARDGRPVHGRGVGAAALLRSPGAGDRQRAFEPGLGAGALVALAQPPAGGAQFRRPLVRRDRARDRRTRGRGRGDARPDRDQARRDAARARRGFRISIGADHARRLDGKRAAQRARDRGGRSLPANPAREPPRAMPPPAARSTARISPTCRWSTRRKTCRPATPRPASRRRC